MASEEPLFDPSLKKKSKKKVQLDVDAELGLAAAPPTGEQEQPPVIDKLNPALKSHRSAGTDAPEDEEDGEAGADGKTADDELAAMFGGMKKKSKSAAKKRTQFAVDLEKMPAPRTAQGMAQAEKEREKEAKEKEKEAARAAGAAAPAPAPAPAAGGDELNFGELKKKKKSSTSKGAKKLAELDKDLAAAAEAEEKEAAAAEGEDDDDDDDDEDVPGDGVDRTGEGDLGEDVFAQGGDDGDDGGAGAAGAEDGEPAVDAWIGSDRDYLYPELLGRIFKTLRAHNPALSGDKKKYSIVPPSVHREGSKKTLFANSLDICKRMHREPEHVYSFLFAELGTIGNLDGNQRLIIKGRFQPKQIENVLRKYIVEYVTCKTCKSPNTLLSRKDRIYFMTCNTCGSTRSVSAIRTGFQAITGKRSKLRK